MGLRRVRAMLPGSVLIPVSISRAVFGHRNTNSPMLRSQRGPTHSTGYGDHGELRPRAAFAGLWISAQAVESKGLSPGVRRAAPPRQASERSPPMAQPESPEHRMVEANGIRLHVAEMGRGPAVLFCHGWPETWYSWRHQLPALAQAGFRALAPDMRGYGRSDDAPPLGAS